MPERPRILLVEDEKSIADILLYALDTDGFKTSWVSTGGEALTALTRDPVDLAIVDIGLPDLSGFELFAEIRRHHPIPVIFLTARGSEVDRVSGLEMGADDYVVKPFSVRELLLRVKSLLKRGHLPPAVLSAEEVLTVGKLVIDSIRHEVTVAGKAVELTLLEFKLLKLLVERRGRVQSRDRLLMDVWNIESDITTRTIDTHVKRLRQKLGRVGDLIETVRGIGYRFSDEA